MPSTSEALEPGSPLLTITPAGELLFDAAAAEVAIAAPATHRAVVAAFATGAGDGFLHLGAAGQDFVLPPGLAWLRELGRLFMSALCAAPDLEARREAVDVPLPAIELSALAASVPPIPGAEYVAVPVLERWWNLLGTSFAAAIRAHEGTVQSWLRAQHPSWNLAGRVCFHLAEKKGDIEHPFAFLATYTVRAAEGGRVQHRPLGQAVSASAAAKDKEQLLNLLVPVHRAAEQSAFLHELVDAGEVFHPLAWDAPTAHRFLLEIPAFEAAGIVVRVPDWWHPRKPSRVRATVTIGAGVPNGIGMDALVDFKVDLAVGDETLTASEWKALLASAESLVLVRGRWVEIDREQLAQVLAKWKDVEQRAKDEGIPLAEAMRLLSGATIVGDEAGEDGAGLVEHPWTSIQSGPWMTDLLATLRDPAAREVAWKASGLKTELRPYQKTGVEWLRFLTGLGFGACLADDMGLGKTVQVLALLLLEKRAKAAKGPTLLVVPASLIANWQSEISRFAPDLAVAVAHPSAAGPEELAALARDGVARADLVITTYGALQRLDWLAKVDWRLLVLDEAQAIKNAGTRQSRAAKALKSRARIALTGTPIENRLGDLWSLFDFLNPGLLGGAQEFSRFAKNAGKEGGPGFGPLRALVRPYILRRLKTDRTIITDLPEKSEVTAWCGLTKAQAAYYQQSVDDLQRRITTLSGIERRGVVLAFLMRFKQICNHPSQWLKDESFDPAASGKFQRLVEIGESIAERGEKALVFTQFREIAMPLARHLETIFGRPGLVLTGSTPVRERKVLVDRFQDDPRSPFFVLSVKAGGTGLNLTAASHVIHFDRWWNPAVENQATDRAFRIGQHKNVVVHKFVCRGTVEERIDRMIEDKKALAGEILGGGGGEALVTEMTDQELLRLVALDGRRALEGL